MRLSGMTQKEIADCTGISRPNLSDYLRGRAELRTDTLEKVIQKLMEREPLPIDKTDKAKRKRKKRVNALRDSYQDMTPRGEVFEIDPPRADPVVAPAPELDGDAVVDEEPGL